MRHRSGGQPSSPSPGSDALAGDEGRIRHCRVDRDNAGAAHIFGCHAEPPVTGLRRSPPLDHHVDRVLARRPEIGPIFFEANLDRVRARRERDEAAGHHLLVAVAEVGDDGSATQQHAGADAEDRVRAVPAGGRGRTSGNPSTRTTPLIVPIVPKRGWVMALRGLRRTVHVRACSRAPRRDYATGA